LLKTQSPLSAREWRMSGQDFLDGLSGCPTGFRAVFGGGSVLENLRKRFNIKKEYADLVRGMIGDVVVENDEAGVVARSISPCAGNLGGDFLDSAVDGTVQVMEWNEAANREGECGGSIGENSNLGDWVNTLLESIWQKKLTARTEGAAADYTSEELDLLFHSWIDLDGLMELEMDGHAGFGDAMGDYQVAIAKDYAYQVYSDVLVKAREVVNAGLKTWDDEGYPLRAAGHLTCNVKPVENVKVGLKAMQSNIQELETGKLRQELLAAMEEVNIQVDVNKKITEVRRERRRRRSQLDPRILLCTGQLLKPQLGQCLDREIPLGFHRCPESTDCQRGTPFSPIGKAQIVVGQRELFVVGCRLPVACDRLIPFASFLVVQPNVEMNLGRSALGKLSRDFLGG